MISIAFTPGAPTQVLRAGAEASAQKSVGIAAFTGMIGSKCLVLVAVPSLFAVLQRRGEWLQRLESEAGMGRGSSG